MTLAPTADEAIATALRFVAKDGAPGTLQRLQRAVLGKARDRLAQDGHFPVIDFPLALHRHLEGSVEVGRTVGAACLLFYAFADVIDDAQDRDLGEALWAEWGWEQAVNTGLTLLFQSLRLAFESLPPGVAGGVVACFVQAGHLMTCGQHVDLMPPSRNVISFPAYLELVERKSGASFGAYAEASALANGQSPGMSARFRALGQALGTLFQMLNDTYELWGTVLSPDYANLRPSLPLVLAREQVSGEAAQHFASLLAPPRHLDRQRELVALLEGEGLRAYAMLRIEVYRRRAQALARELSCEQDPYLRSLLELPAFPAAGVPI